MRVLLDTNVLVSAVLFGGTPRELLRLVIEGRLELVTSRHLLDELEEILERKFGFSRATAVETGSELETLAYLVESTDVPRVCRDPDDDQVLAAAAYGRAAVIVSGDRDLLDLGSHGGIEILTPALLAVRLQAARG